MHAYAAAIPVCRFASWAWRLGVQPCDAARSSAGASRAWQLPRRSRMLLGTFAIFARELAIDLGTANTCVFARGQGIVLSEPSIVAFNTINDRIEAVGNDAKAMVGRTPG